MRPLIAYDVKCGACLWFRRVVGFLDSRDEIGFVSLDDAAENGRLDAVPESLRRRSFHLILPNGGVQSGAAAVPSLLGLLPPMRVASVLIEALPATRPFVGLVYRVLSMAHRSKSCRR